MVRRGVDRPMKIVGAATVLAGTVLVVLAFTVLNWYTAAAFDVPMTFGRLRDTTEALRGPGFAELYFGWLAWTVLALAVVTAVGARLRVPRTRALGNTSAAIAVAGVVATYLAVWTFFRFAKDLGATDIGVFRHTAPGLYTAFAGFLVIGVGSLVR